MAKESGPIRPPAKAPSAPASPPDAAQSAQPQASSTGDNAPQSGAAPSPEQIARPMAPTGGPAAPPATEEKPKEKVEEKPKAEQAKPTKVDVPYAVDRVVMACPRCTSRDTKLVPERGNGPDWVRAHCNPCKRDFKVPLNETAKA